MINKIVIAIKINSLYNKNKGGEIMKRILWLSRHEPDEEQVEELEFKFGPVEIIRESNYYSDSEEVIDLMDKVDADELVVVLPIDYLSEIVDRGVQPLIAIMRRYYNSNDKAEFSHERFVRVNDLELENLIKN